MEIAKGVRDYPPEIQLIREDVIARAKRSFERHGFAPFASPIIERKETLTFKFTGEEDVMKELFTFSDQGGRELGLRFDLTVPLCRFVSMHKDLKLPFKRYEIGRVYRDGPIKLGRYREFWQCDADIVGSASMLADAECIKTAGDVLATLPFAYEIRVNNRKILNAVFAKLGITETARAMIGIDKLKKHGEEVVRKELAEIASDEQITALFALLSCEGTNNGKLKHLEQHLGPCEGITEVREVFAYLDHVAHVVFDATLSRGLNYYTGTVFEAFAIDSVVKSSIAAGGRYDQLIGAMVGSDQEIPAVGISLGIEPLTDALLAEKRRFDRTATQVFVAPINAPREAAQIADRLRAQGINTDLDVMGRSISKNLDYADKLCIPFVMIVGERDLKEEKVVLKNMSSGEEHPVYLEDIEGIDLDKYA